MTIAKVKIPPLVPLLGDKILYEWLLWLTDLCNYAFLPWHRHPWLTDYACYCQGSHNNNYALLVSTNDKKRH